MQKRTTLTLFLCFIAFSTIAQSGFNLVDTDRDKISFQLINNLVIIPVEVNGVQLSFLLDSGVSKPILFNIINLSDSLQINNVETVYLRGLGSEGSIEALKSRKNIVKIGKAININQEIYVVFDESINFASRLGVPIHGIIGYDIFKDLIVEIKYSSKSIKLHNPITYKYKTKCKNCRTFDLTLSQKKPYIDGMVQINSNEIPVKLLIDTGGSDALWLFEDREKNIMPNDGRYFEDYLGKGLSGSVYGKRSKIESFSLQDFKFKNVNVAFPDSSSISIARNYKERSGSISGELLKRFNIIFDYGNGKLTFKKNSHFDAPFHYNKTGIVLEQDGIRIIKENDNGLTNRNDNDTGTVKIVMQASYHFAIRPAFTVVELRKDSPAEKAGLLLGDIVLKVNNKDTTHLKLQDIITMFSGDDGKSIRLKIERNGMELNYQFRLEKLF